jgi:ABC-2 type transport system ATP-binding protein
MLATIIKPTGGSARLAGSGVVRHPIAARAVSSAVFREAVLDTALTGCRNLDLHARLRGIPPSAAASKIAGLAGAFALSESDRPDGGRLQRRPAAAPGDRPGTGVRTESGVPG